MGKTKIGLFIILSVYLLSFDLSAQGIEGSNESRFVVGIYDSKASNNSAIMTKNVFDELGMPIEMVSGDGIAKLGQKLNSVLVIPPISVVAFNDREYLDKYLSNGGNLVILSAQSFGVNNNDKKVVSVDKLFKRNEKVLPKVFSVEQSTLKGSLVTSHNGALLSLSTNEEMGGSAYLEFPVQLKNSTDIYSLDLAVKGNYTYDILTIKLVEKSGRSWTTYLAITPDFRDYHINFSDLVVETGEFAHFKDVAANEVEKVLIGLDQKVLWAEATGKLLISKVELIEYDKPFDRNTDNILDFKTQFSAAKAEFPEWLFNPLRGLKAADGFKLKATGEIIENDFAPIPSEGFYLLSDSYRIYGGPSQKLYPLAKENAVRQIPLLQACGETDKKGYAARFDIIVEGKYEGSSMLLLPLKSAELLKNQDIQKLLLSAAKYMALSPKVLECVPDAAAASEPDIFGVTVRIYNPQVKEQKVSLDLKINSGDIDLGNKAQSTLEPRTVSQVSISCSEIPEQFNMVDFSWNLTLGTQKFSDRIGSTISVRETLNQIADALLTLQSNNYFASYSHWFFCDSYAARVLHAFGKLENNQNYINSALRWADQTCLLQNESGAFTLGYSFKRGEFFIADGGSMAMALIVMAQKAGDIESKIYLDAVRKYIKWRQTFLVTEDRSIVLKAIFGKDRKGLDAGNYGVGMVRGDYVDESIPTIKTPRAEHRGTWYTLACTVGVPAAMALVDDSSEYSKLAHYDATNFLAQKEFSAVVSYTPEAMAWLYEYIPDEKIKTTLKEKFKTEFLPHFAEAKGKWWIENGSRQTILFNPLVFVMRNIENSPRTRAAVLRTVWGLCDKNNPYSTLNIAKNFPKCTFGPANTEAVIYLSFSSYGLMELLEPDSTLPKLP